MIRRLSSSLPLPHSPRLKARCYKCLYGYACATCKVSPHFLAARRTSRLVPVPLPLTARASQSSRTGTIMPLISQNDVQLVRAPIRTFYGPGVQACVYVRLCVYFRATSIRANAHMQMSNNEFPMHRRNYLISVMA